MMLSKFFLMKKFIVQKNLNYRFFSCTKVTMRSHCAIEIPYSRMMAIKYITHIDIINVCV